MPNFMNARGWDQATTILVVDDETPLRVVAAEYLGDCGFHVLEASSADEAIVLLASERQPIDLVFSDVRMPGSMNGFQLAQWVLTHRPATEVILTSGYINEDVESADLFNLGDVLTKPYALSILVRRIHALLGIAQEA